MLEIPEAATLARQLEETVKGKLITRATAGNTPHKFAWYSRDPGEYGQILSGQTVGHSQPLGGLVEIAAGDARVILGEGTLLRYHGPGEPYPPKHQLLLEFQDSSGLSVSVRMYGWVGCYPGQVTDNPFYWRSREKPSPLSDAFDPEYFSRLLDERASGLSVKAFLATDGRIPGLGNGVLQDILHAASLHPRRKLASLAPEDTQRMFAAVKEVLRDMARLGGRDTEKDLFGEPGGYVTRMSRKTVGSPCPRCGDEIKKGNYLGGSIYYCEACQVS